MTPEELRDHARNVLRTTLPRRLKSVQETLEVIENIARNAEIGLPLMSDIRQLVDTLQEETLRELD